MPKAKTKSVTATRVTWLSFLSMALVVVAIGLIGSRYLFLALEEAFILHGAEHNRRIAEKLAADLRERLVQGLSEKDILPVFQAELAHLGDVESYDIFLIDPTKARW